MKNMQGQWRFFGELRTNNLRNRRKGLVALTAATAAVLLAHPGQGQAQTTTNGTWQNTGLTANWSDPTNWVGAVPAGSVLGSDNGTALFNTSVGTAGTAANPIVIDLPTQNVGSINFDNAAGNYTIGTTGGNPLNLNGGGAIQINSTINNQSTVQTVNAPLSLVGGNTSYNLNNSTTGGSLNIGGNINQASGAEWTLNLASSSSAINTLSGNISDGAGGGLGYGGNFVGLNVNSGIWAVSGSNTYSGPTVIGSGATLALESNAALYNTQSLLCATGSTLELIGNNLNVSNGTEYSTNGTHFNNVPTYISNIINPSGNNALNVNIQNPHAQGLTINCSSGFLTLYNNSPVGTGAPYTFIGAGSGLTYMAISSSQNIWNFNSTGTWNLAAGSLSGQAGIQFPGSWNVMSGTVIINDSTTGVTTSTSEDVMSNGNQYTIYPGATLIETPTSSIAGGSGVWNVAGGTLQFLGSQTAGGYGTLGGTIEVTSGTLIIGSINSLGATSAKFYMTGGTLQGTMTTLASNLSSGQIANNFNTSSTTLPANYNFTGGVSILLNDVMADSGNQPIFVYSGISNTSGPVYSSSTPAYLQLHRVHIDDGSNTNSSSAAHTFTLNGPGITIINGIIQDGTTGALPGTFVDNSTGSVTLNAQNNYSGGTIIGAGTLTAINSSNLSGGYGPLGLGGVTLGDAFTTASNASPTLYLASDTLQNPITVSSNTTTGTFTIGSVADANATFSGAITLNQPLTVTMIASPLFFSTLGISGGINSSTGQTVTFAGPGLINVYNNPIIGSTAVTVSGGTTSLSVSNTYTGATNVTGGTLVSAVSGAIPAGNKLSVSLGATFVSDSQGTVSALGSLNMNGNMVVHNGVLATLFSEVGAGYNNGAWNGSGGSPVAISSSAAAADPMQLHAVGVIQNSVDQTNSGSQLYSTFEGQSVVNTDVLLKWTYYGDTDLNGEVDGTDYSRIDNAYLNNQNVSNAPLLGWFNGDFNYDGVVNGSDYTLIDNAFNSQGAAIAAEIAGPTAQIAGSSTVPEPATLGLFGIGAAGLLRRGGRLRRRR